MKKHHPTIPVVYFANGGSVYLKQQMDMSFDAYSIDWKISMKSAREAVGPNVVLAGNVDPMLLYGSKKTIQDAVKTCIQQANGKHVFNLGHGVEKDMSEEAVEILVNAAKETKLTH